MSEPNLYPALYQPTGPQWDVLREFYPCLGIVKLPIFIFYSDVSTSRTLAATSYVQDPMTIETCIKSCQNAGYIYAGVEFGRESSFNVYMLSIDRWNVLNVGVSVERNNTSQIFRTSSLSFQTGMLYVFQSH